MSLVQAAQQMRMLEHEGELSLAEPIPPRKCIVCDLFIDKHPGRGRKPHTCGRQACKRGLLNIQKWRRRNRASRAAMVEKLNAIP